MFLSIIKIWNEKITFPLRFAYLTKTLSPYLKESRKVLDLGSSEGRLSNFIMEKYPKITIIGADVHPQPKTYIPTVSYDGKNLPFPDKSFDCVMLIDVLHHSTYSEKVLKEAKRVTKKYILIKDHYWNNSIDFLFLKLADYIGNKPYGIALPYKYLKISEWQDLFKELNLAIVKSKRFRFNSLDPCKQVIFLVKTPKL